MAATLAPKRPASVPEAPARGQVKCVTGKQVRLAPVVYGQTMVLDLAKRAGVPNPERATAISPASPRPLGPKHRLTPEDNPVSFIRDIKGAVEIGGTAMVERTAA